MLPMNESLTHDVSQESEGFSRALCVGDFVTRWTTSKSVGDNMKFKFNIFAKILVDELMLPSSSSLTLILLQICFPFSS